MAKGSTRGLVLSGLLAVGLASGAALAQQPPVKVGELNSYSRWAAFTVPYRNGWQLALDEINAKGGVARRRKLEIVSRDDGATPGDATRVAEELVTREGVSFLFGSFLSNVGVAMADFANQRKVLYLAAEPLTDAITMAQGNRYTFRVRPNNLPCRSACWSSRPRLAGVEALGDRRAELRVRPVGGRRFQAAPQGALPGRRDRRRAVSGARQDRGRRDRLGPRPGQARRHLQRAVRRRPHAVRARGQHARPVRGQDRAVASSPASPNGCLPLKDEAPRGLDRHRLSLGPDRRPEAQGLRRRLPRQVQRHAAPRLAARLHDRAHDPRHLEQGAARPTPRR